jgi:DNA polymerase III alpha subunit (gram-positive type)
MITLLFGADQEHYDKVRRRNAEQIAISQSQAQARAQAQAQREAQMKAQAQAQREAQMKAQAQAQREAQMKAQAQAQREAQMKAQAQAQREAQMKAQAQARAKDHLDVQQGEEQAKDIDKGQSGAKLGAHQSQVCDHAYREFESGSNTRTRFDQKVLQEVPEVNTHNDTHQELDDQIVELLQDFLDGTLELRGNDGTQFIDEFFGAGTQGKEQTKQAAKERTTLPKEGHAEDDEPRIKVPSEATVFTVPVVANWSDELWTDIEAALVAEVLEELPPRPRGEREEWAANTGWGLKEDTRPFDRRHYKRRHSQDRHNEQQRRRHRNQEDFMKHATRKSQM